MRLIIGIGLINKHTFVVFGVAILIGIILTPLRKYFKNKYFWLGILIVIIIVLPNIFWQIQYDFVSFKLYKNDGTVATPVLMLIPIVALALNPLVFPICLLGIVYLFFTKLRLRINNITIANHYYFQIFQACVCERERRGHELDELE